jgi:hypothetical protein
MTDSKEPTNEQLAKFLVFYAQTTSGIEHLQLNPVILENIMSHDEDYRQAALRSHRQFQKEIDDLLEKRNKDSFAANIFVPTTSIVLTSMSPEASTAAYTKMKK